MSISSVGFLSFGAGTGASVEAVASLANSTGLLLDKSEANVAELQGKGFAAEQADVLNYQFRNVASGAYVFDVIQGLNSRAEMNQALINTARAARDYVIIQHPYFDQDSNLALKGLQVTNRFDKKVKYRPMIADYVNFAATHFESLQISGVAIFVTGKIAAVPLNLPRLLLRDVPQLEEVPKTLRVVIGRKDINRFYAILDRARIGKQLFLWERS